MAISSPSNRRRRRKSPLSVSLRIIGARSFWPRSKIPRPDGRRSTPWLRAMTDYKRPRLLIALDELPRNGIGKILRSAIRADVLPGFASPRDRDRGSKNATWSQGATSRSHRRSANLRSLRCSVRAGLCRHRRFGHPVLRRASGSRRAYPTAVAQRREPRSHRRGSLSIWMLPRARYCGSSKMSAML